MIRLTESAPALLAVLSIFVIGAVAGVVVDRTMLIPAHADAAAAGVRRGVPRHQDEVLAELRTELGLSAEQSRRVQEIFAAHQGEIETAWAQVHANLQRAMQQTTAEEVVEHLELQARVDVQLESLPDMQRACFRLCVLEGLSSREVAEALGVSDATVRTHVYRARQTMRKGILPFVEEER